MGPKVKSGLSQTFPMDGRAWDELVEKVFLSLVCDVRGPLGALSCCVEEACVPRRSPGPRQIEMKAGERPARTRL